MSTVANMMYVLLSREQRQRNVTRYITETYRKRFRVIIDRAQPRSQGSLLPERG